MREVSAELRQEAAVLVCDGGLTGGTLKHESDEASEEVGLSAIEELGKPGLRGIIGQFGEEIHLLANEVHHACLGGGVLAGLVAEAGHERTIGEGAAGSRGAPSAIRAVSVAVIAATSVTSMALVSVTSMAVTTSMATIPTTSATTRARRRRGAGAPIGWHPCSADPLHGYAERSNPGLYIFGTCNGALHVPKSLGQSRGNSKRCGCHYRYYRNRNV